MISVNKINILGYRVSFNSIKPNPNRMAPLMIMNVPSNIKELRCCVGMLAYYAKWIPDFSTKIKPLTSKNVTFPLDTIATAAFSGLKAAYAKHV